MFKNCCSHGSCLLPCCNYSHEKTNGTGLKEAKENNAIKYYRKQKNEMKKVTLKNRVLYQRSNSVSNNKAKLPSQL